MDLQKISEKAGLSLRKLRYVLDHDVLAGARIKTDSNRVGHPRSFTDDEGVAIAVAAALLEAGLRRDLVTRFFDAMDKIQWRRTARQVFSPLEAACQSGVNPCFAEIADGRYVAITIGKESRGWFDLKSMKYNPAERQPQVVVRVDLAQIRDSIRA